ncbi:MAG: alpha/beta hydrolase, partial [Tannerella sp.]|nr:alpha/beta hydrolase [Tannerella sp.]
MKQLFLIITLCISALQICAQSVTSGYGASSLRFDAANFTEKELTLRDGGSVKYRAYENIFFVTNVEDSVYQTVNIFIPENADSHSPIFLKTNIGGYMAAKAGQPTERDATARALQEGFVVVIPGSRGSNSKVGERWTGKAPAGLLDLKAVVRYLRFNNLAMQGDAERIITDGTSAGGAMSSLLGATGNHPAYKPYLQ